MFEVSEFYKEIRKRNKAKFIKFVGEKIRQEQEEEGGINLPYFTEAENEYKKFKAIDAFDIYGYLKPIKA